MTKSSVLVSMHPQAMKSGNALIKVRKGAWGSDEDALLRKCIHKYGEGKWNLVPHRAGLNRCRKSCRLRWLNYLRPTIKRGAFSEDEVDLIMRLRKLLGNRWSLIAGRLQGRTANDIKNLWNTNLEKKLTPASYQKDLVKGEELMHVVIKPLPHTISKGTRFPCYNHTKSFSSGGSRETAHHNMSHDTNDIDMLINKPATPTPTLTLDHDEWWKNFSGELGIHGQEEDSLQGQLSGPLSGLEDLDAERSIISNNDGFSATVTEATGLLEDGWSDIWDLFNSDLN